MSNLFRNIVEHNASWDRNYAISNRGFSSACRALDSIINFSEEHQSRQISMENVWRTNEAGYNTYHPYTYVPGDPAPSLLGHAINAFAITRDQNRSARDTLHQLRFDIQTALGDEAAHLFKRQFYSHLLTSTTPTQRELVDFFREHGFIEHLTTPPIGTDAQLVPDAQEVPVSAEVTAVPSSPQLHDDPITLTADPIDPPVIAQPINDQTNPHFTHHIFRDEEGLINLDDARNHPPLVPRE